MQAFPHYQYKRYLYTYYLITVSPVRCDCCYNIILTMLLTTLLQYRITTSGIMAIKFDVIDQRS